jgi:hypothetical protein
LILRVPKQMRPHWVTDGLPKAIRTDNGVPFASPHAYSA